MFTAFNLAEAHQRVAQSVDTTLLVRLSPSGWSAITRDLITRLKGGKGELSLALTKDKGGFAALVFSRAIGWLRPPLKALPRWTQYLQPALAGLLLGAIGYFGAPEVMGTGYASIDQAMHNQFSWEVLGMLAGLKILSTTPRAA